MKILIVYQFPLIPQSNFNVDILKQTE